MLTSKKIKRGMDWGVKIRRKKSDEKVNQGTKYFFIINPIENVRKNQFFEI